VTTPDLSPDVMSGRPALPFRASKVPEATALFWIIKICTTGMGEAASDFMGSRSVPVAAVLVALSLAVLIGAFVLQFRARGYVPWIYWTAVAMVSVFGTVAADGVKVGLGLSYWTTTIVFALAVTACLFVWYRYEGTLSIHSITTRRREIFYWATVVATFALGTAVGDLTAATLGLGFLASGVIFGLLILVPPIAHLGLRNNGVAAFWAAYVVTRPLGASFADWAGVPHPAGQGLGTGPMAGVLVVVIVALVALTSRRTDRNSTEA
jgi:uncharacterized membrane-anchored protein